MGDQKGSQQEKRPLTRSLINLKTQTQNNGARQQEITSKCGRGKYILPQICIICKKMEGYFTDPVSFYCKLHVVAVVVVAVAAAVVVAWTKNFFKFFWLV